MLNRETVSERLNGLPFRPFYNRWSDGGRILVQHPDSVLLGGSGVVFTPVADTIQRMDSWHIVSLDDAAAKKRNGKHFR